MQTINGFQGEHRWLSNFWPCMVTVKGETYPSAEHAFQAFKSRDPEERKPFQSPSRMTCADAKRAGRKVTLRDDWFEMDIKVMRAVLTAKFTQNPSLTKRLRATAGINLVEANNWGDVKWGVCNGRGKNLLGRLLEEVRDRLPAE